MDPACYFDNAATTPVDPRVLEAMLPYLKGSFGNANSIHSFGREACAAVTKAREQVARLIGAEDPNEVTFTSGATEANNWVLRGFPSVAISPFEHGSVRATACSVGGRILANDGWQVHSGDEELTSVMLVNNETGAILDMPPAKRLHSDATQGIGKIPVDVKQFDFASMSGHKFYGPKGVGALYAKGTATMEPLMHGGEQEHGRRSGTLNVPGIVGIGAAAQIAYDQMEQDMAHVGQLRSLVKDRLGRIGDVVFVEGERQSPYILSACFAGLEGETLVVHLDSKGFAVSAGSACSAGSGATSKVLKALGLPDTLARGAVRFSFGRFNSAEAADRLCKEVEEAVETVRRLYV